MISLYFSDQKKHMTTKLIKNLGEFCPYCDQNSKTKSIRLELHAANTNTVNILKFWIELKNDFVLLKIDDSFGRLYIVLLHL